MGSKVIPVFQSSPVQSSVYRLPSGCLLSTAYFSTGRPVSTVDYNVYISPYVVLAHLSPTATGSVGGKQPVVTLCRCLYQGSKVNVSRTVYGEYTLLPDQYPRRARPAAGPMALAYGTPNATKFRFFLTRLIGRNFGCDAI